MCWVNFMWTTMYTGFLFEALLIFIKNILNSSVLRLLKVLAGSKCHMTNVKRGILRILYFGINWNRKPKALGKGHFKTRTFYLWILPYYIYSVPIKRSYQALWIYHIVTRGNYSCYIIINITHIQIMAFMRYKV